MEYDILKASKITQDVVNGKNIEKSFDKYISENNNKKLIKDIVYGSLRSLFLNEFYLMQFVKKEINNLDIKYLILNAFYQITFQHTSNFTVVDQNVKASKLINSKFSGFVNAVLRNFIRNKIKIKTPVSDHIIYSYQDWWVKKIETQFPEYKKEILSVGNSRAPLVLRVNVRKIKIINFKKLLEKNNISYELILDQNYIEVQDVKDVEKIPGFNEGYFYIQDPSAQLAINYLELKENMEVLDICAAPGGKASHILEKFNINLDCFDISNERIKAMVENFKRLDLKPNIIDKLNSKKKYDFILADVPCSASGVVRRNIDSKIIRKEHDVIKFQKQQIDILNQAWSSLKKNGKLLYMTCSIFNEENDGVVEKFIQHNTNVSIEPIVIPKYFKSKGTQIIPNKNHDGLFFKLLSKD